jgi:hypothetical protein
MSKIRSSSISFFAIIFFRQPAQNLPKTKKWFFTFRRVTLDLQRGVVLLPEPRAGGVAPPGVEFTNSVWEGIYGRNEIRVNHKQVFLFGFIKNDKFFGFMRVNNNNVKAYI